MNLKKIHFPIFFWGILSLFLSCDKKGNPEKEVLYDTLIDRALVFQTQQKYDSAFYYFYKAKQACKRDEKDKLAFALFYIAEIQQKHCDFVESEATATKSIAMHPTYKYINSTYNLLGLSYLEQYNFSTALKYFHLAAQTAVNPFDQFVCQNNIGYAYLEAKQYRQAKIVLTQCMAHNLLLKHQDMYAKVLDNLGYAYFKLKNPQAISCLTKALQIRIHNGDFYECIASYMHLAEYYQDKNSVFAQKYATEAFRAASQAKSPDDKIEALKFLIAVSRPSDSQKLALQQIRLADSLTHARQLAKNQFAKIKYDFTKTQQENTHYKFMMKLYLVLLFILLLLTFLSFLFIKYRNQKKLQQASYLTEIRISKRLHDELANDVFHTMAFAETKNLTETDKKETLLDRLEAIYAKTRDISRENSEIHTGENFATNLFEMMDSYNSPEVNVLIKKDEVLEWQKLKKEKKIALYRVLQELLVNMKKHSRCSVVILRFENQKKHLKITYSDNGIGCPEMVKNKKGLLNAENRIHAIKGTITFETKTNRGLKVFITIPKSV